MPVTRRTIATIRINVCVCVWEREREWVCVYACVAQALGGKPHAASIHVEACPVALSPDILRQVPSTFFFLAFIYIYMFFLRLHCRESLYDRYLTEMTLHVQVQSHESWGCMPALKKNMYACKKRVCFKLFFFFASRLLPKATRLL